MSNEWVFIIVFKFISSWAPTIVPTVMPTIQPTVVPTTVPTLEPTVVPTKSMKHLPIYYQKNTFNSWSNQLVIFFSITKNAKCFFYFMFNIVFFILFLLLAPTTAPTVVPSIVPSRMPSVCNYVYIHSRKAYIILICSTPPVICIWCSLKGHIIFFCADQRYCTTFFDS